MLPTISKEQNSVIIALKENNNVIVDSVAGSGKTTCILHIATEFKNINILLLTYNAKLKIETRTRVSNLKLKNLEVHSYHSFCVKYYDNKCFTDSQIFKLLLNKTKNKKYNYDLIILDESQDINPTYYELICKIYKDNDNNARLCLLGDRNQSIYQFNKADERFLIYANKIFNFNKDTWVKCKLTESFRITYEMSNFINSCMFNCDRIKSVKKSNNKPRYIICDTFDDYKNKPFDEVLFYLQKGYTPEDIFILAPSIKTNGKNKSPVRVLENKIKNELNILIYIPSSDEEKIDDEIIKNKLVFSTYHQTKGLERKVIIIFGFDSSYFNYFNKNANSKNCSNELYVASTRGSEYLTLLHHHTNNFLPFLNTKKLHTYCNVYIFDELSTNKNKELKNLNTPVTDIIKHLPSDVLEECMKYFTIKQINKKIKQIEIIHKTKQKNGFEHVSDITGTAIPAYFEYKITNKLSFYDELLLDYPKNKELKYDELINFKISSDLDLNNNNFIDNDLNNNNFIDNDLNDNNFIDNDLNDNNLIDNDLNNNDEFDKIYDFNKINIHNLKLDELLYISNLWSSKKSGLLFKVCQITKYNWLNKNDLDLCVERLYKLNLSSNAVFEKKFELENKNELSNRKIIGYVDCIDNNNLYEFKCVSKIENEHYLQLAIYIYLYETQKLNKITYSINDKIIYIRNNMEIEDIITNICINGDIKVNNHNISKNKIIKNITFIENNKSKCYLYNILSDELNEICYDYEQLKNLIKYLIVTKYDNYKSDSDDIFISKISLISSKYFI